jgi:hypothetical protein
MTENMQAARLLATQQLSVSNIISSRKRLASFADV